MRKHNLFSRALPTYLRRLSDRERLAQPPADAVVGLNRRGEDDRPELFDIQNSPFAHQRLIDFHVHNLADELRMQAEALEGVKQAAFQDQGELLHVGALTRSLRTGVSSAAANLSSLLPEAMPK